jgi:hypothetical protein
MARRTTRRARFLWGLLVIILVVVVMLLCGCGPSYIMGLVDHFPFFISKMLAAFIAS